MTLGSCGNEKNGTDMKEIEGRVLRFHSKKKGVNFKDKMLTFIWKEFFHFKINTVYFLIFKICYLSRKYKLQVFCILKGRQPNHLGSYGKLVLVPILSEVLIDYFHYCIVIVITFIIIMVLIFQTSGFFF